MHCNFPIRQCFSSTSLIPFSNNRGLQVWIVANFFLNALPDVLRLDTECSSSSLQTIRGHPKNRTQTKKKNNLFSFFCLFELCVLDILRLFADWSSEVFLCLYLWNWWHQNNKAPEWLTTYIWYNFYTLFTGPKLFFYHSLPLDIHLYWQLYLTPMMPHIHINICTFTIPPFIQSVLQFPSICVWQLLYQGPKI